jgi:hypothetical protein
MSRYDAGRTRPAPPGVAGRRQASQTTTTAAQREHSDLAKRAVDSAVNAISGELDRRRVGARLAADGLMQSDEGPWQPDSQFAWLRALLVADPGDTGCDIAFQALDRYAEADLADSDPRSRFPGVTAHLAGCRPCGQDYQGLLTAARREAELAAEPTQPNPRREPTQADPIQAEPMQPELTQHSPPHPEPTQLDPTRLALCAAG